VRGFERVTLGPGESRSVSWTLDRDDVGYYLGRADRPAASQAGTSIPRPCRRPWSRSAIASLIASSG
jgi:hypothetical protein